MRLLNFSLAVFVSICCLGLWYSDAHAARSFSSHSFGGRSSSSFGSSLRVRPMSPLPKPVTVPPPRIQPLPRIQPAPAVSPSPHVQTAPLYRVRPLYRTTPGYQYNDYYYHAPVYQAPSTSWWDIWFWSYMFSHNSTPSAAAPVVRCGEGTYLDKNNTCQQLPKCGANQRLTKDMVCEVIEEPKKTEATAPTGEVAKPNWEKALEWESK